MNEVISRTASGVIYTASSSSGGTHVRWSQEEDVTDEELQGILDMMDFAYSHSIRFVAKKHEKVNWQKEGF